MNTNRRGFLRSAALLSVATAVPATAFGGCVELGGSLDPTPPKFQANPLLQQMVETLKDRGIYSAENEKEWAGKAVSHAPSLSIVNGQIEARTAHAQGPIEKPGHFILSQFAEAENGDVLSMAMFTRHDNDDVVGFLDVPSTYSGIVRVYSYCTEHDLWASEITV